MSISPVLARLSPTLVRVALVLGVHLLAVGHDLPGGGFIGALVIGSGVALSVLANQPLPAPLVGAQRMLGLGLAIVAMVGVVPAIVGGSALDMTWLDVDVGALGTYKVTSALVFDIGVALVVVGLVVTVVRSLQPEERP